MQYLLSQAWQPVFANDMDPWFPEIWAAESLMVLYSNMVTANLVHRNFSNEIANFGDVVNTRRPSTFTAQRKVDTDDVTIQDASATNVAVTLNQHFHTSFLIRDGEESKGFKSLRDEYLEPAIISIAQAVDEVLAYQMYSFLTNSAGKLGTAPTASTIIDVREKFNNNKAPLQGRNMIITPNVEGDLLGISDWVNANTVGDDGTALREGHLGRKYGMNFFMTQNAPTIASGNTTEAAAVNNASGYAIGSTSITIDGTSSDLTAGSWCTIAGDMTPQLITAASGSPTTSITISPGLKYAVDNDAVITIYSPGAVNLVGGYAANYAKEIVVDGFTVAPKVGQLCTIGAAGTYKYGIMTGPDTTGITLDRPLEELVANDAVVGIGPAGEYCFAFHPNAIALVSRPLAKPADGTGALSAVANYNGVTMRVTITYNGTKQGHLVTCDLLCGVKVLDTNLGVIMYG